MKKVIVADNVTRTYGKFTAVDGVSFHVAQGELVALLGSNGAGKTSLLEVLQGSMRANGGCVQVFGLDGDSEAGADFPALGFGGAGHETRDVVEDDGVGEALGAQGAVPAEFRGVGHERCLGADFGGGLDAVLVLQEGILEERGELDARGGVVERDGHGVGPPCPWRWGFAIPATPDWRIPTKLISVFGREDYPICLGIRLARL